MGNYTELFYHFIWATRQRIPMITPKMEETLYGYIHEKCKLLHIPVYALNGMPDHLHIACSIPASRSLSDFVETIKGSSAYFINQTPLVTQQTDHCLYWQRGYGALTFSKRDLPWVVDYIEAQKERHAVGGRLSTRLEATDDGFPIAPKGVANSKPGGSAPGLMPA